VTRRLERFLSPRQQAFLEVDGQQLGARVEEVAGGTLTLALFTPDRRRPEPVGQGRASISVATPVGIIHLEGHAEPSLRERVRFRYDGDPQVVQRREFARADVVRPVAVGRLDKEDEEVSTWTVNVSGNGLLIAGPAALKIGDEIWFRVSLGEDLAPVEGRAKVVREDERGRKGLRITDIRERDRELLVHFVLERQRQALRMIRGS